MNNQGWGKHGHRHGHGHEHGGKHHGHGGHHGHHGHRHHRHRAEQPPSQDPNFHGERPMRHHWGKHGGWHHFKAEISYNPWNYQGLVPPIDNINMTAANQHTTNNINPNVLQNEQPLATKKIETSETPAYILCPITQAIMTSPAILKTCGHSFDEKAIRDWLQKSKPSNCPLCKTPASEDSIGRNFALADAVDQFLSKNKI